MVPPISDDLSRISKAAKQLNSVSDQITKQIRDLDAFLSSLHLGLEFSANTKFYSGTIKNDNGHKVEVNYFLAYGRDDADGKFGLLVEAWGDRLDKDGNRTFSRYGDGEAEIARISAQSLNQAPRMIRLAAAAELPGFLTTLADDVETDVADGLKHLEATKKASEELRVALAESPGHAADTAPVSRPRKRLTAEGHRNLLANEPEDGDETCGKSPKSNR
jgi:hypothetical protein